MPDFGIPTCCGQALETSFKMPGHEYWCPICKRYYQLFDVFQLIKAKDMTHEQLVIAAKNGWVYAEERLREEFPNA